MNDDFPILLFEKTVDWADWLELNGLQSKGFWMRIAKKNAKLKSITYDEALTVALCYGWIDGLKKTYDENSWIQRFTARGNKSTWSLINKEKALQLISDGRMTPNGLASIEIAKKNGNWDKAYPPQSKTQIPADLQAEFDKSPEAAEFFNKLNSTNKYAILHRLHVASNEKNRQIKLLQFVEMLENGKKIYD
jgi:uncharacterized protein YdeI (YjbR/CyaY-like superfamily)